MNDGLELAVRGSNIGIWDIDMPDGDFRHGPRNYVNIWERLGYERLDFPPDQETSMALVHPDDRALVEEAKRHCSADYTNKYELDVPSLHKDGSYRWMLARGVAVRDARGKPIRFVGSGIDITDFKRAEEALRQSEAESRRLLEFQEAVMANMGEGLYAVDTQGFVTYMNPAAERLFGWTSAELLGQKMHDRTHYRHADGRPFPIEECAGFHVLHEGKALKDYDDLFIRKDGTFFPVVYSSSPLVSEGTVAGLVVVFRDVTQRKRAEEEIGRLNQELRSRLDEMQAILDIVPMGIGFAHDPECRLITHNPYMTDVFGLSHWRNASLSAPPDERPDSFRVYRDGRELPPDQLPMQVACTGVEVRDFEMDVVRTDGGGTRKLLCYVRPLKDAEGRIRGSVGAFLDVTERKQAEEELRRAKEAAESANRAKD